MWQRYYFDTQICDRFVVVDWDCIARPFLFRFGRLFLKIRQSKWFSTWTYKFSCPISDITCINSFIDIQRFSMSLVTTIYSEYFNWIYNSNAQCIIGKELLYVIGLLQIIFKQFATVIRGMGSSPNSKNPSSHTPSTIVLLIISIHFFILGQLYSFHEKVIFRFAAGYSLNFVTVNVYCSSELSDNDSMGINSLKPTSIGLSPSFASSAPRDWNSPTAA